MGDDETRLPRAQWMQILECGLAVVERAQGIDRHDDVERAGQRLHESFVFDVAGAEREFRIGSPRLGDHLLAEIDSDAERRRKRRNQVTGATAELEHARALWNQKLQIAEVFFMKERRPLKPFPTPRRVGVGKAANLLLACGYGSWHSYRFTIAEGPAATPPSIPS